MEKSRTFVSAFALSVLGLAVSIFVSGCQSTLAAAPNVTERASQVALNSIELPGRLLQFREDTHWKDFDKDVLEKWAAEPYEPFDPLSSNECNLLTQMGRIMALPNQPRALNPLTPDTLNVSSRALILENLAIDYGDDNSLNQIGDGLYQDVLFSYGIWRFDKPDTSEAFLLAIATAIENCGPMTSRFELPDGSFISQTARVESSELGESGINYVISGQASGSDGTSSTKEFTAYSLVLYSNSIIVSRGEYDIADLTLFDIDESEFLGYTRTVSELLRTKLESD